MTFAALASAARLATTRDLVFLSFTDRSAYSRFIAKHEAEAKRLTRKLTPMRRNLSAHVQVTGHQHE